MSSPKKRKTDFFIRAKSNDTRSGIIVDNSLNSNKIASESEMRNAADLPITENIQAVSKEIGTSEDRAEKNNEFPYIRTSKAADKKKQSGKLKVSFMKLKSSSQIEVEINKIIKRANECYKVEAYHFKKVEQLALPPIDERLDFKTVLYKRKIPSVDQVLKAFGIAEIHCTKYNFSVIVFCYRKIDPQTNNYEAFAVTSGHAYDPVLLYADYDFVRKIAAILFTTEGMRSSTEKKLIGNEIENSRSSVLYYNASSYDYSFVTKYKTKLRKQSSILELKCFNENVTIDAGEARLRFNQGIDLKDIYSILNHFSKILRNETTFTYTGNQEDRKEEQRDDKAHKSSATKVPNNLQANNISVWQQLDNQLINHIKTKLCPLTPFLKNTAIESSDLQFYHKHNQDYLSGSSFTLKASTELKICWSEPPDILAVLKQIQRWIPKKISFETFITQCKFGYTKSGTQKPIFAKVLSYIHGSVLTEVNGIKKVRWRSHNLWFEVSHEALVSIEKDFVAKIHSCLIEENYPGFLPLVYRKDKHAISNKPKSVTPDEGTDSAKSKKYKYEEIYNYSYYKHPNLKDYYVGDQILALKGIEIFDILHFQETSNEYFLYHVKESFGQNTRAAMSQLRVSMEYICNELTSDSNNLKPYYEKLKDLNGHHFENRFNSFDDFLKCLKSVTFVYAFTDSTTNGENNGFYKEKTREFVIDFESLSGNLDPAQKTGLNVYNKNDEDQNLCEFKAALVNCNYITNSGEVTGKLLYESETNFIKEIQVSGVNGKRLFSIIKPFTTRYKSLLAKMELIEVANKMGGRNKQFKICQIPFSTTADITVPPPQSEVEKIAEKSNMCVEVISPTAGSRFGIPNTGNSCYRNAAIQLLIGIEEFCHPSTFEGADSYLVFKIKELVNIAKYPYIYTPLAIPAIHNQSFSQILSSNESDFIDGQQDDSASFFLAIINKLSTSFKELFQYTSITSGKEEVEKTFPIPITKGKRSIQELLDDYLQGNGSKNHSVEVKNLSKYVVLHLKIFKYNSITKQETKLITRDIEISQRIKFQHVRKGKIFNFELIGMISHHGSTFQSGHYICKEATKEGTTFTVYDDEIVERNSDSKTTYLQFSPYVILYKKMN